MMTMATMRRSMQQKHSLHQLHPRRFQGYRCLLSSFSFSVRSDPNDGNTRSGRDYTARRRFNTTFHALPLLFQNDFSSFQQQQQQQQRRWFGNTALVSSPSHPASQSPRNSLPVPTVVYSDNHLLAVNKPAGWHSVPNIPKKRGRRHNQDSHRRDDGGNIGSDRDSDNDRAVPPGARTAAENRIHRKCLLTHLRSRGLGGGSQRDFLLPLHRIDQPCTGVLLFGKTSKAASRITAVWKGKKPRKRNKKQKGTASANGSVAVPRGVAKEYLCVVPTSRLAAMEEASVPVPTESKSSGDSANGDATKSGSSSPAADGAVLSGWNRLDGLMLRQSASSSPSELYGRNNHHRWQQQKYYNDRRNKGKSVRIVRRWRKTTVGADARLAEPRHGGDDNGCDGDGDGDPDGDRDGAGSDSFYEYDHEVDNAMMRPVSVDWKTVDVPTIDPACTLLLVRTSEGARHMVRALLAQVGNCPIVGDLRYWTTPERTTGRGRGHSRPGDRAGIHDGESDDARDRDRDRNGDRNQNRTRDRGPAYDDKGPLPDRSVALHAYGVVFDRGQLRLGSLETFEFRAPVPSTWKTFFGIENRQVKNAMRRDTNTNDLGFGERL